jgi:predicted TIM-barrel fold metal-dependent hydrolase
MPAVDSHAHVIRADVPTVAGARYRPGHDATLEDWQALWPICGITHGVLIQPSVYGTDNTLMLEAIARDPEHLRGVAVVAPDVDARALRSLHDNGIRGLRLNMVRAADLAAFDPRDWRATFAAAADLGWHVELHAEGTATARLLDAMHGCPAPMVVDHFGRPDAARGLACPSLAALRRLAERRRVYVKLSAPYRCGGADVGTYARHHLATLGAERLLWASDWPWTQHECTQDYAALHEALLAWVPDAAVRAQILWDNPRTLFAFT